jgi:flagellar biosynthesis protein FlhG
VDQAEKLRFLMKKNLELSSKLKKPIGIYTIASGKGGVGKTNVVVNLAIALQKRGKKVLIIDADLGMANVDVILGLYPQSTLYDVLFHGKSFEETIINGPEGIKILPGGSGIMEMATLSVEKQEAIAHEFLTLEDIDIILIDTGAGISKNLLSFITFSQELIIVTTPEPTALTDAYSVIKVMANYKLKDKIQIIINKCPNGISAINTYEKLRKTTDAFLKVQLVSIGYILEDPRVVNSVMKQIPFVIQYPQCIASKCIDTIADKILGQKNSIKIKSIQEVYNRLLKVFG